MNPYSIARQQAADHLNGHAKLIDRKREKLAAAFAKVRPDARLDVAGHAATVGLTSAHTRALTEALDRWATEIEAATKFIDSALADQAEALRAAAARGQQ